MKTAYKDMDWRQKEQYQKFNTSVNLLKAMATIAAASEEDIQELIDIRPSEVYTFLTGEVIGEKYLNAITDAELNDWQKTALQLSKVWQDIKMPIRKMLQWKHADKSMTARFKQLFDKF